MSRIFGPVMFAAFLGACSAQSASDLVADEPGDDVAGDLGVSLDGSPTTDGGAADTDASGESPACTDLDEDGFGVGCSLGPDCDDTDGSVRPGADELCGDDRDNDCDLDIDEDCSCATGAARLCFDGAPDTADVGACQSGVQTCTDGVWSSCDGQRLASREICDGADNDCDGEIDNGVTNACGTCGEAPPEICDDGLDNDCNGVIDDVIAGCACGGRLDQPCYSGPPQTLGAGACVGGRFDCIEGEWGACEGEQTPVAETCDGIDNDCDFLVDEGLRNLCGECGPAPDEVCDGIDNNCDGRIDEGVLGTCGLCPDELTEEACGDGFDNNCDGQVDEGCACVGDGTCYPGPAVTVGVGRCQAGTQACGSNGEAWEACTGYVLPDIEVCDGVDNDCDGTTDLSPRGCSLCSTDIEVCDGVDNDCDALIDEGLRNRCGTCFEEVVAEETQGDAQCDGLDNDCDGRVDEDLLNDCGTCDDESCSECEFFEPGWSAAERCGDGQDNNENGEADEGCPCTFGATQRCFLGAPNGRRIGACLDGQQSCIDRDDPRWGPCEGGILPSLEVCDGKDNDCNGCTDEGTCDVILACPVEDWVRPLRFYPLEGGAIYDGLSGEATNWSWTVTAPDGSATTGAEAPGAASTRFYVDVSGDYLVSVTFTVEGTEFSCSWIVHAAGDGLRVELTWDTQGSVDLDLHMHRPGNTQPWCSDADCYYVNCDDGASPPWGYPDSTGEACPGGVGTCRNPRLDIDNINRVGVPENINIDNPNDGDTFRVMVHYFGFSGGGSARATQPIVALYCGGVLASRLGEAPDVVTLRDAGGACQGDTWRVADVTIALNPETGATTCSVAVLEEAGGWLIRNDSAAW
jgi:hypothetical protein